MSKAGLTRKKITVRRGGKSFQRSVMVRAEAIGKRTSGKALNSLNPWMVRHTKHVHPNPENPLGERAKLYGSSGPGSDHSWMALLAGSLRQEHKTYRESGMTEDDTGTRFHRNMRFNAGRDAGLFAESWHRDEASVAFAENQGTRGAPFHRTNLEQRYGRDNVHQVYQDPRKHVHGGAGSRNR